PDVSRSRRRGADRLAARSFRGRGKRCRPSGLTESESIDFVGPWQCKTAAPYALYDALHPQPRGNPTLNAIAELNDLSDRSLLIVEDDKPFLERLSRAMETRGFAVTSCDTVTDGLAQINNAAPAFAVVDLRRGD